MTIDPNKILYVYNSGEEFSEELALSYSAIRQIPSQNLLGIDTFTKSLFSSRSEFESELLNPILNKIDSLGGFPGGVNACVLGFRIPSGYISEYGSISCCGAISGHYIGLKEPSLNPSYRKNAINVSLKDFGIMPCCQHDMPTFSLMKRKIEEFAGYRNGITKDGFFYFDRWSLKDKYKYDSYAAETDYFEEYFIKKYFDKYYLTAEPIDDLRSDFAFAENDSFFWSSGLQNLTSSYFKTTNRANRIFFFNADSDYFYSSRNDGAFGPSIAALSSGYLSSAWMMSELNYINSSEPYNTDPYSSEIIETINCWLRPEPFFESLSQNMTILESMYFASPIICCPMTYFCDPLSRTIFNSDFEINKKMSSKDMWKDLHEIFSKISTLLIRRINASAGLVSRAFTHKDMYDKIWALDAYKGVETGNIPIQIISQINPAFSSWKRFAEVAYFDQFTEIQPSFFSVVNKVDFKFTNSFIRLNTNYAQMNKEILSGRKESSGFFVLETYLPSQNIGTGFYQIRADIYLNEDDEEPVFSSISYNERDSWKVESFDGSFNDFPSEGLFSSLTNRKIKFYNRKEIPEKNVGDEIWVKFTFSLNYSKSITSNLQKALVIS